MNTNSVYYLNDVETVKFGPINYLVKLGYDLDQKLHIACNAHERSPKFCFMAATREAAFEKAKKALTFYHEHGLTE